MNSSTRGLRFGFGFYLGISAVIHACFFMAVSFYPLDEPEPKVREVVPTQVKFREPIEQSSLSESVPEYLPVDSFVSTGEGNRLVREATGLPGHMRSSPRPHAYAKANMTRYVELPDPEQLAPEYQPPTTQELPEQIREIEVTLDEMEPLGRIPTVRSEGAEARRDLMSLGDEVSDRSRRRLQERPSFPYARVRPHLPSNETWLKFMVGINENGDVVDVKPIQRQGASSELIDLLSTWLSKWSYQPGEGTVQQEISIEIPEG